MVENVENRVKVENGHVFVVLGAHVRVLIPITCPFNANVCMSIKDANFDYKRRDFLHCFILFSCRNGVCAHIDHSVEHFGHS